MTTQEQQSSNGEAPSEARRKAQKHGDEHMKNEAHEDRIEYMKAELDREIEAVVKLKDAAWKDLAFTTNQAPLWELHARLNGLFYARALIHGQEEVLQCYQTGMNPNSNGARYTPKEVVA